MKRLLLSGVVMFTAVAAAFAFDPTAKSVPPARYAIVRCPASDVVPFAVAELTKTLRDEMRSAGLDVRVVPESIDDYRDEAMLPDADVLIEVTLDDANTVAAGGVGTGVHVGGVIVGGDFGVVHTRGAATVRLYDAASLDLLEEFVIASGQMAPALTSISVGDPHGYLWFEIPVFHRGRQKEIARGLAKDAAARIAQIAVNER